MNLISHFFFFYSFMRLDLFLKASRLIARRTLAQKFCDANLVKVNDADAKSSREIKLNDEIEIKKGNRLTRVKVLQIPAQKQIAKHDAASLYEVLTEETLSDDVLN
jgi:ribosomal 50S subunit-recycling heat shock protein